MRELVETLRAWQEDGVDVGRAVVIRSFGSAPRPEGAVLLGAADGRLAGSVSGGCVEGAAYEEIERARRTGRSRVIRYGISDEEAWDVGLACGGTIDVLVEPTVPRAAIDAARQRGIAVATILPPDAPPSDFGRHEPGDGAAPQPPIVVGADGTLSGSLGSAAADDGLAAAAADALLRGTSRTVTIGDRQVFVDAVPKKPRLVTVGSVEVARPLAVSAKA